MAERVYEKTLTLSGTGNAWDSESLAVHGNSAIRLRDVKVRNASGSGATAADVYIVASDSAVSAAPDQLNVGYLYEALTLTASDTDLSLSDPITAGGFMRASIGKQVAANVTGSGAWTVYVTVSYTVGG